MRDVLSVHHIEYDPGIPLDQQQQDQGRTGRLALALLPIPHRLDRNADGIRLTEARPTDWVLEAYAWKCKQPCDDMAPPYAMATACIRHRLQRR